MSVAKHVGRSLRSGGLPLFFSILMSALGLFSLTAFSTLLWNFRTLADSVSQTVAAVAFLDADSAAAAEETRARISMLPGVSQAIVMTPEQALSRAKRGLSKSAALDVDGLSMPWVIEVVPSIGVKDGSDARARLLEGIAAVDGVADVAHPGGELARVDALLRLLYGAGAFLGVLIALVVVVVVSNAVRMTVLVRKDEIAIQKLVGASDAFVAAPLLLSGVLQGTAGAIIGLLAMAVAQSSLAQVVKVALSGALGTFSLEPLPVLLLLALVFGGGLLGALGAGISVWRYLRSQG
jgi:cell division transport system permease protein